MLHSGEKKKCRERKKWKSHRGVITTGLIWAVWKKHGANWRETCCSGHLILQWWTYHCLSGRQGGPGAQLHGRQQSPLFLIGGSFCGLSISGADVGHCFCTAGCCVGKDTMSQHRQHIGEEILLVTLAILSININISRVLSVEPIIHLRVKWKKCSHTHWCQLQIVVEERE